MAVKYAEAKRYALSLPGVTEEPHFGIPSFRVNKRIIVTVPPGDTLHVFVSDAERDMCLMLYSTCTGKGAVGWQGGRRTRTPGEGVARSGRGPDPARVETSRRQEGRGCL